jgi:hypothetical protein
MTHLLRVKTVPSHSINDLDEFEVFFVAFANWSVRYTRKAMDGIHNYVMPLVVAVNKSRVAAPIGGTGTLLMAVLLLLARSEFGGPTRLALRGFVLIDSLVSILAFGVFEAGYNYELKVRLFLQGRHRR